VLKYINELAGTMEPYPLINQAEVLYLGFRSLVEATDRRKAERASLGNSATSSGEATLRKRNTGTSTQSSNGSTATLSNKDKEKDTLIKIVNDEAEAEARVPDITLSDELRALAF